MSSDEEGRRDAALRSDDDDANDSTPRLPSSIPRRSAIDLPDDDESPAEDDEPPRRDAGSARRRSGSPKSRADRHRDDDDDDEITPAPRPSTSRKSGGRSDFVDYGSDDDDLRRPSSKKKVKQEKRRHSSGKRDLSGDEYSDGEDDGGHDDDRPKKRSKRDLEDEPGMGEMGGLDDGREPQRKLTAYEKSKEQAKAVRRSRKRELDPTVIETECVAFLERMMKARDDDLKSFKKGQPALEKIKMLRVVEMMMNKVQHREYLLDNMLLPVFRAWLDRLPDGTLPNVEVRTTLLSILFDMRIDEDWVERLEGSQGLGKVIHFLSRNEDYEPNRRVAEKIMMKWARPVYKMDSNFSELLDEFNKPEEGHRAPKDSVAAERKAAMKTVRRLKTTEEKLNRFQNSSKGDTRVMASMPKPTPFLFTTVAEGSSTIDENIVREVRTNKAKTKKINRTMSTLRRLNKRHVSRGSGPSVNGR